MLRKNVTSSNVKSVGYETDTETLEIEFHSGGIYQYFRVSEYVYNLLMSASSIGGYFDEHIKDRYHFNKIR
ncbi:MAG: hypothetical protein ACD_9C00258G0004 [uncultured bacterium]|nr:MAG: hypothetical protein ACD_9C00258G0004 [uncultured bacterium]